MSLNHSTAGTRVSPAGRPNEFWAALIDKKADETVVGIYDARFFNFKPVVRIPKIIFDSMDWAHPGRKNYWTRNQSLIDRSIPLEEALQMVKELDEGQGVLIMSDIYGATPCNLVSKLLVPGRVEGVAGVNLPMLVRALTYRNGSILPLVEKALSGGHEGVVHFTEDACSHHDQA